MRTNTPIVGLLVLLTTGCGDWTTSTGEMGRATYRLHTDYEMDGNLDEVAILTGHTQRIDVGLTDRGWKRVDFPGRITHTVTPDAGVTVIVDDGDPDDPDASIPELELLVENIGSYTLETWYDDTLLDYLELNFAPPDGYDVVTWTKAPDASDFEERSFANALSVEEGTQVAFVAIPIRNQQRLVGQYTLDVAHDPDWAAVTVHNVLGVYEQEGVWGEPIPTSLVFVDPATVNVTLTDTPNGVTATQTFEVSDLGAPEATGSQDPTGSTSQ